MKKSSVVSLVSTVLVMGVLSGCTGDNEKDSPDAKESVAKSGLPVAASTVLRVGEEEEQEVRVAIHALRRVEGATVLDWSVTALPTDGQKPGDDASKSVELGLDAVDNQDAINLVDATAKQVYRPLDFKPNGVGCLCVPWFAVANNLEVSETRLMQTAFPELPKGQKSLDVSFRNLPLVAGMPITARGSVPAGSDVDLAAEPKERPTVSDSVDFEYPLNDEQTKPQQKFSLVVNEIVAAKTGTSLTFTITPKSDWGDFTTYSGSPLHDPDLVASLQSMFETSASGPGLRPSQEAADSPVTRAWHTTVRQREDAVPNMAAGTDWLECLCTRMQTYGERAQKTGRDLTMTLHLPAQPEGTKSVDVVFPDDAVAPIDDVPVTKAPSISPKTVKTGDLGTWSSDWTKLDWPEDWTTKDWPTPAPEPKDIAASKATVDDLVVLSSDAVAVESDTEKKIAVTLDSTVSFQPDSAKLTAKAKFTIQRIAGDIDEKAKAGSTVLVEGHVSGTDKGSVAVQKKLSTDRANAVRKALEGSLTVDLTLKAVGRGATQPVAPNDSEQNRKANRRVVVTYQP